MRVHYRFKTARLLPLLAALALWLSTAPVLRAQGPCPNNGCATSSLNITTGLGSGTYDNTWKVNGRPAFIVYVPNPSWAGGGWISNSPGTYYWPNGAFPYQMCFCLCDSDSVTFNFNYLVDDIANVYVDGTLISSGGTFTSPTSVNTTLFLSAGMHCLNITVYNTANVSTGLQVNGSIQSSKLRTPVCCDPSGHICGVKYADKDRNGQYNNAIDSLMAGWKIYLYDNNNNLIDSTVTDAEGNYCFFNKAPGMYYVYEENRAGWSQIYPSGYNAANVQSNQTISADFGNFFGTHTNRICGLKYYDQNCNGVRDSLPTLEPGVEYWNIYLYDSASGQTTTVYTDSLGRYCFDPIFNGTYTVSEESVTNWYQSQPGSPFTYRYVLDGNDSVTAVFGNCLDTVGRICGMKWNDLNGDGVKQANEPPIPNWVIYLNGTRSKVALTDAQGQYCFNRLPDGVYVVSEQQRFNWRQIAPNNPNTYTVTLAFNEQVSGRNFGNRLGRNWGGGTGVGDTSCFPDTLRLNTGYNHNTKTTYGNAEYDAFWEVVGSPIAGTLVPVPAMTIDESYSTSGWNTVLPSSRWISLHRTSELAVNTPLNSTPYSYQTCFCHATDDYARLTLDIYSDDVFNIYLDSVLLGSYLGGGHFTPSTKVHIDTVLFLTSDYHCLRIDVWNNGGILHGLDVSGTVTGFGIMAHKCCFTKSRICGVKFADNDQDGQQNVNYSQHEPLLKNWKIYLMDASNNIIDSTLTDTLGNYCFEGWEPGNYHVAEESRTGWRKITPTQPYNTNIVGLNEVGEAKFGNYYDTTCFVHDTLGLNTGYDYNTSQAVNNGLIDPEWTVESNPYGAPKHSAYAMGNNAAWKPAQSNSRWIGYSATSSSTPISQGLYVFQRCFCLKNGFTTAQLRLRVRTDDSATVYVNGVYAGNIPANTANGINPYTFTTSNASLFHNGENCVQVRVWNQSAYSGLNISGELITQPNTSANHCCGIVPNGSISGYKWNDLNHDGVRQDNEPLLPNWPIHLYGSVWQYTDSNGYYYIPNLEPNYYTVMEADSPHWRQSFPYNDGQSIYSGSHDVEINPGQHQGFVNFGNFYDPENSSICGFKWEDRNQDGMWDPSEPKLSNWGFVLSNGDTVYTDGNGEFCFDSLGVDTYTVVEINQPDWYPSYPGTPEYTIAIDTGEVNSGAIFGNYQRCFKETEVQLYTGNATQEWQIVQDPDPMTPEPRPSQIVFPTPGPWAPAQPGTDWLGHDNTGNVNMAGMYVFERCFCIKAGMMLPSLTFDLMADEYAQVDVNGISLGSTPNPGYTSPTSFTVPPTSLRPGKNCIQVRVNKTGPGTMGMNILGNANAPDSILANQCCGVMSEAGLGEKQARTTAGPARDAAAGKQLSQAAPAQQGVTAQPYTLTLIPNPASAVFRIQCKGAVRSYDQVEVYDMLGRKVTQARQVPVAQRFDLSDKPAGTYFVVVNINGQMTRLKLTLK